MSEFVESFQRICRDAPNRPLIFLPGRARTINASGIAQVAMTGGCDVVKQVGLWVFHGSNDNPNNDTMGMNNFMACAQPRKEVKYTLQQGADHVGSWERVYDDMTVMKSVVDWLLTFTKP